MNNIINLKEARNNLVAKDNRMIQNSRYALTPVENKAILYLISKIRPGDEPGKRYSFNCKEFQALIRWNVNASYKNIKGMLTKLSDMRWWIDLDESNDEALVRWFHIVHINKGNGNIEITFHEDMFPFLLDLQKHLEEDGHYYTTYKLQNVTLMKNRYSPRLYEILKSYQYNNKKWTFENGTGSQYDIQRKIADTVLEDGSPEIPKTWNNWAIFRRNVLDPAIEEINKYTDIKIAYEGKKEDLRHRKTRAVRSIEFYLAGKTTIEQMETEQIIEAEYSSIESELLYEQLSIEELFFQEHNKKVEEEVEILENNESQMREEKYAMSELPILSECLNGIYDEEQLKYLYNIAIRGRVAGEVSFNQWERFATDIITYYYEFIKATPEDTKTTTYKRLLDMVRNDYHNIVPQLIEQYSLLK